LSNEIEENKDVVLRFLHKKDFESHDEEWVTGNEISEATDLKPSQINDAIELLRDLGLVEWLLHYGTSPYDFGFVKINARGKYEIERRPTLDQLITEEPGYAVTKTLGFLKLQSKHA